MSELAEERSIGGGAKRAKIRVNAVTHGGAGLSDLLIFTVRYCLNKTLSDLESVIRFSVDRIKRRRRTGLP